MVEGMVMEPRADFSEVERKAVYRALEARRDVRRGFTAEPLPDPLLRRLLAAAHCAPSVGLMQPSRFVVVRDPAVRKTLHGLFESANAQAAASYAGNQREQ